MNQPGSQAVSRNAYFAVAAILIAAALPLPFAFRLPSVYFLLLIAIVAVLIAYFVRRWREPVGSTAFGIYWILIGFLLALAGSIFIAEDVMTLHRSEFLANPNSPRPPSGQPENNALSIGWGICAAYITASAILLGWVRRKVLGGTETGIYWLGSMLTISIALFWLFTARGWQIIAPHVGGNEENGLLAAAIAVAIMGTGFMLYRRGTASEAERTIYWLASAAALGCLAAVLARIDNVWISLLFVIGAVVVTIPFWHFARNRAAKGA